VCCSVSVLFLRFVCVPSLLSSLPRLLVSLVCLLPRPPHRASLFVPSCARAGLCFFVLPPVCLSSCSWAIPCFCPPLPFPLTRAPSGPQSFSFCSSLGLGRPRYRSPWFGAARRLVIALARPAQPAQACRLGRGCVAWLVLPLRVALAVVWVLAGCCRSVLSFAADLLRLLAPPSVLCSAFACCLLILLLALPACLFRSAGVRGYLAPVVTSHTHTRTGKRQCHTPSRQAGLGPALFPP
jgi:hypothetical protein